jgi:hypothetical protein
MLLAGALGLAGFASSAWAAPEAATPGTGQVEWKAVDRVVAFADVHGAYAELTQLLQSVGVIDGSLHWSAGKTHLVSLGDLLDRGDDSRKVMDLLMRLQQEAAAAGGQVHVVLGNHEAMNVLGDLRYVSRGEYASYAADEDPAVRAGIRTGFLTRNPTASEADFDRLFPPGYFGQRKLLGPDGKYGRWLLELPAAIVINYTVYMHGGPSTTLGSRGIAQLNQDYSAALSNYLSAESELRRAGLLQPEDSFGKRPDLVQARLDAMPQGDAKSALAGAVARFKAADDDPLLGSGGPWGPNWYRGTAFCNECAESDVLKPFLRQAGAKRLVIGHTTARNGTVVSRFDGAVVKLDAGMNQAVYHGHPAALITDAAGSKVAYVNPPVPPAAVPPEPLYISSQTISEPDVADILARGTIEVVETCAPSVFRVRVTSDGRSVDAVFESATGDTVKRELAAYRLDRLLGLGLVPATVARDHAGQSGVLQGRPPDWVSEQDRQNLAKGTRAGLVCQSISNAPTEVPARRPLPLEASPPRLPRGGWCDLGAQFQLSYAFDVLIGNQGRTFDRYLYGLDPELMDRGYQLFLAGHGAAFGTGTGIPKPLEASLAKTGPEMQDRLRRLDAASVRTAIGEFVGDREIKALLQRRDRILELAGGAAGR